MDIDCMLTIKDPKTKEILYTLNEIDGTETFSEKFVNKNLLKEDDEECTCKNPACKCKRKDQDIASK